MDKWKIAHKRTIYKSKFFSLEEEEITLPNKKKKIYDLVRRKSVSVVFPISSSGELYLISEFRTLHSKYMTEAIAGHIDDGESPLDAAKRELKEETGLSGKNWEKFLEIEMAGSVIKSTGHLFIVKDITEGKANPDEEEDIKLLKIPFNEAVRRVMSGEINLATTVVGILFLDKLKREGKL